MANKNFEVKHGLSVGGTERITSAGAGSFTDLTLSGNLTVSGSSTTLNTATLDVEDKNIKLNKGSGDTSGSADGAGITIQDAVDASTDATLLWNASTDNFELSHGLRMDNASHILFERGGELRSLDTGGNTKTIARVNSSNELQYGWSASGPVAFMGGGSYTERMRIHTNANIGIGDTDPVSKLTVTGPRILVQRTNDDASISFANNATGSVSGPTWSIGRNYSNSEALTFAYHASSIPSLESSVAVIKTNGFLGLGTTSPLDLIHIKSSTTDARQVIDGHTGYDAELKYAIAGTVKYTTGYDSATDKFVIGTTNVDTSPRMTINSSGFVNFPGTASVSGKFAVMANAVHGSYDFYNNGTMYNNGAAVIDDVLHISGSNALLKVDGKAGILNSSPNGTLHIGTGTNSAVSVGTQSAPALQIGGTDNYRLGMYTDNETGYIENKNGDDGIVFKLKTVGEVMRLIRGGNGAIQLGGTSSSGYVDFDGTVLQLNTQRNPNTGAFADTGKSHAGITLSSASADSHIKFYTTGSNNTAATESVRINSAGNMYIIGGNDRRIKLSDSGIAGVSDSNNTVHIRGDNDYMKLMAAGNGGFIFEENGSERFKIYPSGSSKLTDTGIEVYNDIYSGSGSSRGAGYFRFLTDGSGGAEQSVAQIYMEQGTGDGASRKCNMYFQVADNGSPSTAMTIENNKIVSTATNLNVGTTSTAARAKLNVAGGIRFTHSPASAAGLNVVGQYSFNNSNTDNACGSVYYKMFMINFYHNNGHSQCLFLANGGGGVGYGFTVIEPGSNTIRTGNTDFSFTTVGSSPNTFRIKVGYGNGNLTVNRTSGTGSFQVSVGVLNGG